MQIESPMHARCNMTVLRPIQRFTFTATIGPRSPNRHRILPVIKPSDLYMYLLDVIILLLFSRHIDLLPEIGPFRIQWSMTWEASI